MDNFINRAAYSFKNERCLRLVAECWEKTGKVLVFVGWVDVRKGCGCVRMGGSKEIYRLAAISHCVSRTWPVLVVFTCGFGQLACFALVSVLRHLVLWVSYGIE